MLTDDERAQIKTRMHANAEAAYAQRDAESRFTPPGATRVTPAEAVELLRGLALDGEHSERRQWIVRLIEEQEREIARLRAQVSDMGWRLNPEAMGR